MKYSIHDEDKVKEILAENGHKPFRYKQIENAIYKNFIENFDDINTISKDIREMLKENFYFQSLNLEEQKSSSDNQTTKMLWRTHDDKLIESVIMRHKSGRKTLCVSSQVWCAMACSFCATWKLGIIRDLTFSEIAEQIVYANKILTEEDWNGLRNIVYMGMWEPFNNYDNVKKSIDIATNQMKVNLSNRRVTISTCGVCPSIDKFTQDFPQTSLAISLHAPNDELRNEIMPVNKPYQLEKLMASLDNYIKVSNKKIFYEYIMINWVNDSLTNAKELAELLAHQAPLAHVNFIPYNPGEGSGWIDYQPSPMVIIKKFQDILSKNWIPSTIRATLWDDIDAACGQLANKRMKEGKNITGLKD